MDEAARMWLWGGKTGLRGQLTIFPKEWQEKSPPQKKRGIPGKVWYH